MSETIIPIKYAERGSFDESQVASTSIEPLEIDGVFVKMTTLKPIDSSIRIMLDYCGKDGNALGLHLMPANPDLEKSGILKFKV
jgi:hypothetical protein